MSKALRDVYGESLTKYAKANDRVVVLDADLSNCSKTCIMAKEIPERMFNVGIAEANMIAMGAGFASAGYIPFVNTFATLAASMCALCMKALISYSDLNVRLVGVNNGLCGGYDGSTHHAIDDLNVMRAIPGMLVITPSDPVMTDWVVDEMANSYHGPVYISLSRNGYAPIYQEGEHFELGKAKQLRFGSDAAIFACGLAVTRALKAAEILEQEGIHVSVFDMFTVKPLDKEAILYAAGHTGAIVTVEEHSVVGGLGTAIMETLSEAGIGLPIKRVGIQDCYTESGSYEQLLHKYQVDSPAIADAVKDVYFKKRV